MNTAQNGDLITYGPGYHTVTRARPTNTGFVFEDVIYMTSPPIEGNPMTTLRQATCCATCAHLRRSVNNVTTCGLHDMLVQTVCDDHTPEAKEANAPVRRALGAAGVTVYDYFEDETDD